jgi:hypothetical protein
MHRCLGEGCNQIITYRFAICAKCEKRYGRAARGWPPWLRYLWNEIQKSRRKEKKIRAHEVQVDDEFLNNL